MEKSLGQGTLAGRNIYQLTFPLVVKKPFVRKSSRTRGFFNFLNQVKNLWLAPFSKFSYQYKTYSRSMLCTCKIAQLRNAGRL